jgi:hypothetical protein
MRWIIWILSLLFLLYAENRLRTAGEQLLKPIVNQNPPDLSIGISKDDFIAFLEAGGPDGRRVYVDVIKANDFLYPLAYGVFFSYTIFLLASGLDSKFLKNFAFLPIVSMLADFTENSCFILLASEYPEFNNTIFFIGRNAQMVKWYGAFASILVILILIVLNIRKKFATKSS